MVGGIQRIYDGGWDPRAESGRSKSEQVKHCVDREHCLCIGYTRSPLTSYTTTTLRVSEARYCMDLEHCLPLATLGAVNPLTWPRKSYVNALPPAPAPTAPPAPSVLLSVPVPATAL
jgi:hypothetical protein